MTILDIVAEIWPFMVVVVIVVVLIWGPPIIIKKGNRED